MVAGRKYASEFLERLRAECVDAERTLHTALGDPGALSRHLDGTRRARVREMIGFLGAPNLGALVPCPRDLIVNPPAVRVVQRVLVGGSGLRMLTDAQASFIRDSLHWFDAMCSGACAGPRELLIAMRMRMYGCQWMLEKVLGRRVRRPISQASTAGNPRAAGRAAQA